MEGELGPTWDICRDEAGMLEGRVSAPSRDRKEAVSTGSWDLKVGLNRELQRGIFNISLQAAIPERFVEEPMQEEGTDEPKIITLSCHG